MRPPRFHPREYGTLTSLVRLCNDGIYSARTQPPLLPHTASNETGRQEARRPKQVGNEYK